MAKRFIDSKIWSDPWFQEIDVVSKLFWIYLFSICDIIGIWEYNPKRAEFDLCKRLPWDDIKKNLEEKVLFVDRYWIIKNFIKQQYPKLAEKPNAPLHISVLNQIKKKCLNFDLNSLSIDYRYPIDSLQVKEEVKVIEKEEVKEEVKDNELVEDTKRHRHGEYNHVLLTGKEYDKLLEDFGESRTADMIKRLDEGIELKGYKYKNHNLALRKWEKNPINSNTAPRKYGRVDLTPESFKKQMEYVYKDAPKEWLE